MGSSRKAIPFNFIYLMAKQYPKPYINPLIQQKLTEIGGLVQSGKFAGQPKIKIVWGPDEKQFDRGKMRPRFVELGTGKHIWKKWFISPELHAKLSSWVEANIGKHTNPAKPLRIVDFMRSASTLDYFELESSDNPISEIIAPEGWFYIFDLDEYQEKLLPFWFVLQYVSPGQLPDTPESWAAYRYAEVYVPELHGPRKTESVYDEKNKKFIPIDTQKVWIDVLGEFPADGDYFHEILRLYETDAEGNKTAIEPTFDSVVFHVQKLIQARDGQSAMMRRNNDFRNQKFMEKNIESDEKEFKKKWDEFDVVAEDMRTPFDNASSWLSMHNPPKK